jgi:DNA-binding transcriptional ArsR family regulator
MTPLLFEMNAEADLESHADEAVDMVRALANRNRLVIVCTLIEGEYSVGQLEDKLGVGQPTLSRQLAVLRAAGLIEPRRAAKRIFYRLTEGKTARLVLALHRLVF